VAAGRDYIRGVRYRASTRGRVDSNAGEGEGGLARLRGRGAEFRQSGSGLAARRDHRCCVVSGSPIHSKRERGGHAGWKAREGRENCRSTRGIRSGSATRPSRVAQIFPDFPPRDWFRPTRVPRIVARCGNKAPHPASCVISFLFFSFFFSPKEPHAGGESRTDAAARVFIQRAAPRISVRSHFRSHIGASVRAC